MKIVQLTVNLMTLLALSFSAPSFADKSKVNVADRLLNDANASVESVIAEVVDDTVNKARQVVRENTGVDLRRRGYGSNSEAGFDPGEVSEGSGRKLEKLAEEHDRKIHKLEDELEKKISKARTEFERDAGKEDKADNIAEKRRNLRQKVDKAYAKFDEKVSQENRRFDKKRGNILGKGKRSKEDSKDRRRSDKKDRSDSVSRPSNPDGNENSSREQSGWWKFWE